MFFLRRGGAGGLGRGRDCRSAGTWGRGGQAGEAGEHLWRPNTCWSTRDRREVSLGQLEVTYSPLVAAPGDGGVPPGRRHNLHLHHLTHRLHWTLNDWLGFSVS